MAERLLKDKQGNPRSQTAYEYGVRAESNARNTLKTLGYRVIRAAASQGPFDLIALHPVAQPDYAGDALHRVVQIQVKRGDRPSPCDYKEATVMPTLPGALTLVLWYPHGKSAARVLYCADGAGPVDVARGLPPWCGRVRWLPEEPKQARMRLA